MNFIIFPLNQKASGPDGGQLELGAGEDFMVVRMFLMVLWGTGFRVSRFWGSIRFGVGIRVNLGRRFYGILAGAGGLGLGFREKGSRIKV